MGTVGRRVSPRFEALFTLAYFDLSSDLRAQVLQQQLSASRDASWVDPMIGLNYRLFSWYFGYRYISYDYETGNGINFQHYDLQQHGPGIGVAWSF